MSEPAPFYPCCGCCEEIQCAPHEEPCPEGCNDVERCPECESHDPGMHPAVSGGGEVTRLCPHPFHASVPVDERVRRVLEGGAS